MTQFHHKGSLAADDFLQSRIVDKSVAFHSPMKKLRLKTFVAMAVKKVAISQQKSAKIKVERNLFGTILLYGHQPGATIHVSDEPGAMVIGNS